MTGRPPLRGGGLATLEHDDALERTVTLAAGDDVLFLLQGQMDDPAMVGTEGAGGLGLACRACLLGEGNRKFAKLLVLTLAVVARVKLDAHGRVELAGHDTRSEVLYGGEGLPFGKAR